VAHDATTPFTVQLIPGSQHWFYSGGTYQYFTVAADGAVDYDPALEGALTGRGNLHPGRQRAGRANRRRRPGAGIANGGRRGP